MSEYAVQTAFTGKDGVTGKLNSMAAAVDQFGHRAKGAFGDASHAGISFRNILGGILSANLIGRGMGYVTEGVRGAISSYVDFDDAVTAAAAHFDSGYARGSKTFNELKVAARDVGATTEYSAVQAAKGLDFLAKAGLEPVFAMKTLKSYVDLATASAEEFESATSMAVDIMGAFQLNTGTTEEKIQKFNRANDTLVKIVNMSNLGLTDLFETIKFAGPVAVDAGVSLEKFGAIAALVGGAGIKGSLAGTAIRSALLSLTGGSAKVRKEFGALGIKFKDIKGNIRDPIAVFEDLRKKMDKMGSAQRLRILGEIFGERAISGVSVSIAGGAKALDKYEQALKNAGGEASKTAELMRQSIGKRLDLLKASALELAFKFLDAVEKKIPGGIDGVTEAIRKFDVRPAIDAMMKFANALSKVCDIAKELLPVLEGLAIGFITFKTLSVGIGVVKSFVGLSRAIKTAGSTMAFFNIVMAANPIGAAVIAVSLLVAASAALALQWKEIKEIFEWVGDKWDSFIKKHDWLSGENIGEAVTFNLENIGGEKALPKKAVEVSEPAVFERAAVPGNLPLFGGPMSYETEGLSTPAISAPKAITEPKIVEGKAGEKNVSATVEAVKRLNTRVTDAMASEAYQRALVAISAPETVEPVKAGREAPNRNDVLRHKVEFNGRLDIAGAPAGSRVRSRTIGAPPIDVEFVGANL
jgi:TP901 family phage tail tape measure protein